MKKPGTNSLGLTVDGEYDRWVDGRKDLVKKLREAEAAVRAIDTSYLDVPTVDAYLCALRDDFKAPIEAAAFYSRLASARHLLSWVGPYGAVLAVASKCGRALEAWAAQNRKDSQRLAGLCAPACLLLRKKLRRYARVDVMCGTVKGELHYWCAKNGVAIDLTYTQFDAQAERVYVVPASKYPAQYPTVETDDPGQENVQLAAEMEKLYR